MTLEVKGLRKQYSGRYVVNGVSFHVNPGQVVGLLGPNGAGKTTAFYSIVGLVKPDDGDIQLDGQSILKQPIHVRARQGIGYLPQETSIFRQLTVEENLQLVQEFQPGTEREKQEQREALMEEFEITAHRKSPAIQLSGGERRRVEIARAIAINPRYLLLDEPFTGIDPIAIEDIQQLIMKLKQRGLGVLLTDHNPRATLKITDDAYIITDGKVIYSGPSDDVAKNPMVRKYYLGSDFVW
jgi:lipopolysaccharide export system ATP-binding protein